MADPVTLLEAEAPKVSNSIVPAWAHHYHVGPLELWQALGLPFVLVVALLVARFAQTMILRVGRRIVRATSAKWDDDLLQTLEGPLWLFLGSLLTRALMVMLLLPESVEHVSDVAVNSVAIAAMVWLANRALQVGVSAMEEASDHTDASGRSFKTSMQVTRRLVGIIIWVVGISVFLLQFQVVRSVGLSLLASAGIAGVAFGFAAQRSIAQLLAGIQLSLTQPIRLGDQVTIDKQFGEVEEIHLTYVVLRTWDLKRLVVPINRFLDGVFENWSLGSLKVMAAVNLKLDYSADIDALRAEVQRLLATDSAKVLWDQTVWRVRVLETDTQSVSVRISVSVPDASKGFELECLLREALLGYLRARPSWLSRGRSETISLGPKDAVG